MRIEVDDKFFNEEELKNTPRRIKKFIEEEWKDRGFNFTVFPNPNYDEMIILKDIEFESLCSHHLMPFFGKVHIAYIPGEKICGLSKLARVVDKFAHRPQIQEKLTQEIVEFLSEKLKPKGVMVVIEAQHTCITCRGACKKNAVMVTSAVRGVFREQEAREEFLNLIRK